MSENRRLEWDVLLEQEPQKPPIRTEPKTEPQKIEPEPIEFEPDFEDIVAIPQNQVPERPAIKTETKRQPETKQNQQHMNILEGNITPNQLVNAFILSEIFGKPKGLRRGSGRRR